MTHIIAGTNALSRQTINVIHTLTVEAASPSRHLYLELPAVTQAFDSARSTSELTRVGNVGIKVYDPPQNRAAYPFELEHRSYTVGIADQNDSGSGGTWEYYLNSSVAAAIEPSQTGAIHNLINFDADGGVHTISDSRDLCYLGCFTIRAPSSSMSLPSTVTVELNVEIIRSEPLSTGSYPTKVWEAARGYNHPLPWLANATGITPYNVNSVVSAPNAVPPQVGDVSYDVDGNEKRTNWVALNTQGGHFAMSRGSRKVLAARKILNVGKARKINTGKKTKLNKKKPITGLKRNGKRNFSADDLGKIMALLGGKDKQQSPDIMSKLTGLIGPLLGML